MFILFLSILASLQVDNRVNSKDLYNPNKHIYNFENKILDYFKNEKVNMHDGLYCRNRLLIETMLISNMHGFILYKKAWAYDYGIFTVDSNGDMVTISLKSLTQYLFRYIVKDIPLINKYRVIRTGNYVYIINVNDINNFFYDIVLHVEYIQTLYYSRRIKP